MDPTKKAPILQRRPAAEPLTEALGIESPQLGPDREDGLGLGGEVEAVGEFMIVNPLHAEPVVEQDDPTLARIDDQPVEEAVQIGEESRPHFLVEREKDLGLVRRTSGRGRQAGLLGRIGRKMLPGEEQRKPVGLVPDRKTIRVGSPESGPADIGPELFVHEAPGHVVVGPVHGREHATELVPQLGRITLPDDPDESRHLCLLVPIPSPGPVQPLTVRPARRRWDKALCMVACPQWIMAALLLTPRA